MPKEKEDKFVEMLKKRLRYSEKPVTCSTCATCVKELGEEGETYECHTLPDVAVFGVKADSWCNRHQEKKKPRKKGGGRKKGDKKDKTDKKDKDSTGKPKKSNKA
jgi:hypothetical protein